MIAPVFSQLFVWNKKEALPLHFTCRFVLAVIKDEIVSAVVSLRNSDIGERREKRKHAKELRQRAAEAEAKKKKEKERKKEAAAAASAAAAAEGGADDTAAAVASEATQVTSASSAAAAATSTFDAATSEQVN